MSIFGWSYPPGAANDPYAPYNQNENYGEDISKLLEALKPSDTGRWRWDCIDICLTGKDADLEPWGQQGIQILSANDEVVRCRAHFLVSHAGTDVRLNEPTGISEEDLEVATERYLDRAQNIIAAFDYVQCEWDGDNWICSGAYDLEVPWILDEEMGIPKYEETAAAVLDVAADELKPVEEESILVSDTLNVLAGWKTADDDDNLIDCEQGKPGNQSVFYPAS